MHTPSDAPEPGHLPSTKLADFVRCRDLTCRFPGCDEPAEFHDIDHTFPIRLASHTRRISNACAANTI